MLVDDEAEVRESILLQIPWEDLGFEVVADAVNGEDALEKMAIYEPGCDHHGYPDAIYDRT